MHSGTPCILSNSNDFARVLRVNIILLTELQHACTEKKRFRIQSMSNDSWILLTRGHEPYETAAPFSSPYHYHQTHKLYCTWLGASKDGFSGKDFAGSFSIRVQFNFFFILLFKNLIKIIYQ